MIFILIFCGISAFVNNLNLSKSYECSEPPAEKQERKTLYYKEIDRRILHDKTINLKIIFYETTITFSIADVINVGWVYEGTDYIPYSNY